MASTKSLHVTCSSHWNHRIALLSRLTSLNFINCSKRQIHPHESSLANRERDVFELDTSLMMFLASMINMLIPLCGQHDCQLVMLTVMAVPNCLSSANYSVLVGIISQLSDRLLDLLKSCDLVPSAIIKFKANQNDPIWYQMKSLPRRTHNIRANTPLLQGGVFTLVLISISFHTNSNYVTPKSLQSNP